MTLRVVVPYDGLDDGETHRRGSVGRQREDFRKRFPFVEPNQGLVGPI